MQGRGGSVQRTPCQDFKQEESAKYECQQKDMWFNQGRGRVLMERTGKIKTWHLVFKKRIDPQFKKKWKGQGLE